MTLRIRPRVETVKATLWGPEPIGAARAGSLAAAYGQGLAGEGNDRSIRWGLKGSAAGTFSGDLGPLQTFRVQGSNAASIRPGLPQGFPGTKGPVGSTIVQTKLGLAGI